MKSEDLEAFRIRNFNTKVLVLKYKRQIDIHKLNIFKLAHPTLWKIGEDSIFGTLPSELITHIKKLAIRFKNFPIWYHKDILDDFDEAIRSCSIAQKQPLAILFSNKISAHTQYFIRLKTSIV